MPRSLLQKSRPLLRLATRANSRPSLQPLLSFTTTSTIAGPTTVQQRRAYAKPRVRRATPPPPPGPLMTVPLYSLERWTEVAQIEGWKEVDPVFFRRCFMSWLEAYEKGGTDELYNSAMKEHNMTVKNLHHLAIYTDCICLGPQEAHRAYAALVRSMLHRASALGHEASTLTLFTMAFRTAIAQLYSPVPADPSRAEPDAFMQLGDEVNARFAAMLELGDVPDAMVLSGRLALLRGDPAHAEEMFRRAEKVAKENPEVKEGVSGRYELRGSCLVGLGTAMMARVDKGKDKAKVEGKGKGEGKTDGKEAVEKGVKEEERKRVEEEAMGYFREAAEKYNMAAAWQQMAYGGRCDRAVVDCTWDIIRGNDNTTMWNAVIQGYNNMAAKAVEAGDQKMFLDCQTMANEYRKAAWAETVGEGGE